MNTITTNRNSTDQNKEPVLSSKPDCTLTESPCGSAGQTIAQWAMKEAHLRARDRILKYLKASE